MIYINRVGFDHALKTSDGKYIYLNTITSSAYIPNNIVLDKLEFINLNNITDEKEIDDVMNDKVNIYGVENIENI
jgi:hypothetical protein